MKFIAHRINTLKELREIPENFGIEVDLRDRADRLILSHDPFSDGEDFENLLKEYSHGTLILNIKSERVEHRVLELLIKYKIKDYFFLDSSIPMINLLINQYNESKIAIRYSEIEPFESLESFKGKVDWVWVDCFTKFILTKEVEHKIRNLGMKICLVSPELQGRDSEIESHVNEIVRNKIKVDAVCSKIYNLERWR